MCTSSEVGQSDLERNATFGSLRFQLCDEKRKRTSASRNLGYSAKSEQYSDVGIHEQTIVSNFDPQYKLDVLVDSSENLPFKVDPSVAEG